MCAVARKKSDDDFELKSEGFRVRVKESGVEPAQIPKWAARKCGLLRSAGYLPTLPEPVIINTHQELVVSVMSAGVPLGKAVEIGRGLKLTNGTDIEMEPEGETVDFYQLGLDYGITRRMRCYLAGGGVRSVRIIVADVERRPQKEWRCDGFAVAARSDGVYVVREDMASGQDLGEGKIQVLTKRMAKPEEKSGIAVVVYKRVVKGNFGRVSMWDHRRAVLEQGKFAEDATESLGIWGMGPYIVVAVQEVWMHHPDGGIPFDEMPNVLGKLAAGVAEKCFRDLVSKREWNQTKMIRFEIECRGKQWEREGAEVARQLVGPAGLLDRAGWEYELVKKRKVDR